MKKPAQRLIAEVPRIQAMVEMQQQGAADQLDCAHEEDVVGVEHCAHELTCKARR